MSTSGNNRVKMFKRSEFQTLHEGALPLTNTFTATNSFIYGGSISFKVVLKWQHFTSTGPIVLLLFGPKYQI